MKLIYNKTTHGWRAFVNSQQIGNEIVTPMDGFCVQLGYSLQTGAETVRTLFDNFLVTTEKLPVITQYTDFDLQSMENWSYFPAYDYTGSSTSSANRSRGTLSLLNYAGVTGDEKIRGFGGLKLGSPVSVVDGLGGLYTGEVRSPIFTVPSLGSVAIWRNAVIKGFRFNAMMPPHDGWYIELRQVADTATSNTASVLATQIIERHEELADYNLAGDVYADISFPRGSHFYIAAGIYGDGNSNCEGFMTLDDVAIMSSAVDTQVLNDAETLTNWSITGGSSTLRQVSNAPDGIYSVSALVTSGNAPVELSCSINMSQLSDYVISKNYLGFWIMVSDPDQIANAQARLLTDASNYYYWDIRSQLTPGWNYIRLRLNSVLQHGNPSPNNLISVDWMVEGVSGCLPYELRIDAPKLICAEYYSKDDATPFLNNMNWAYQIRLTEGANYIVGRALDIHGNEAVDSIIITYNTTADTANIDLMTINGKNFKNNKMLINTTNITIEEELTNQPTQLVVATPTGGILVSPIFPMFSTATLNYASLNIGENCLTITYNRYDISGNFVTSSVKTGYVYVDQTPPVIKWLAQGENGAKVILLPAQQGVDKVMSGGKLYAQIWDNYSDLYFDDIQDPLFPVTINFMIDDVVFRHNAYLKDLKNVNCGIAELSSINALAEGVHTLQLFSHDAAGNRVSSNVYYIEVVPGELGIQGRPLNYPNPFNPSIQDTMISYYLLTNTPLELYVFNLAIEPVYHHQWLLGEEGTHFGYNEIPWNGRNNFGEMVTNGVYLYQLVAKDKGRKKVLAKGKIAVLR